MYPSIIAHIFSGSFLIYSFFILLFYSKDLQDITTYQILVLMLLFSLAVGIHSISHAVLEKQYSFIPFLSGMFGSGYSNCRNKYRHRIYSF